MAILPLSPTPPPIHSSPSPPPPSLPASSSDLPLFAIGTFTEIWNRPKYLLHALSVLFGSLIYFTPISSTDETLVGGRNPLSFVIGCAEVTLARVNLPPFTCYIKIWLSFLQTVSPDLSIQ